MSNSEHNDANKYNNMIYQNYMDMMEAMRESNDNGSLDSLVAYGNWITDLSKSRNEHEYKIFEDQLIRVVPKVIRFVKEIRGMNRILKEETEGYISAYYEINDSSLDDEDDNFLVIIKNSVASKNYKELSSEIKKMHEEGNLDSFYDYGVRLNELLTSKDDPVALIHQAECVFPAITKFYRSYHEINIALKAEMTGEKSEFFVIDDSFFDLEENDEDE